MRVRQVFLLLIAALLAACESGGGEWAGTITDSAGVAVVSNPEGGVWRQADLPTVQREVDIGTAEGNPEYQFGLIAGLDVGSDGAIYVFDQQNLTVRVFNPEGTFLRQMGRPGSGPGELGRGSAGLLIGLGDTVFVPDIAQQRMVRYTHDGQDAGSFALPLLQGISLRWAMTDDYKLVQQTRAIQMPGQNNAAPQGDYLFLRDAGGTIQDTLLTLPAGKSFQIAAGVMPRMRLFESEPIWALSTEGKVLYGLNSEYAIRVYDRSGKLERIIKRPFQQTPVTESDRQAFLGFLREAVTAQGAPPQFAQQFLSSVEFADFYPAFAQVLGGVDGTIWVQRIQSAAQVAERGGQFSVQDVGGPVWDVFDPEGRYLGPLELPDRFAPTKVRGDQIYGIWRDSLDVQHVVRLRVSGIGTK